MQKLLFFLLTLATTQAYCSEQKPKKIKKEQFEEAIRDAIIDACLDSNGQYEQTSAEWKALSPEDRRIIRQYVEQIKQEKEDLENREA